MFLSVSSAHIGSFRPRDLHWSDFDFCTYKPTVSYQQLVALRRSRQLTHHKRFLILRFLITKVLMQETERDGPPSRAWYWLLRMRYAFMIYSSIKFLLYVTAHYYYVALFGDMWSAGYTQFGTVYNGFTAALYAAALITLHQLRKLRDFNWIPFRNLILIDDDIRITEYNIKQRSIMGKSSNSEARAEKQHISKLRNSYNFYPVLGEFYQPPFMSFEPQHQAGDKQASDSVDSATPGDKSSIHWKDLVDQQFESFLDICTPYMDTYQDRCYRLFRLISLFLIVGFVFQTTYIGVWFLLCQKQQGYMVLKLLEFIEYAIRLTDLELTGGAIVLVHLISSMHAYEIGNKLYIQLKVASNDCYKTFGQTYNTKISASNDFRALLESDSDVQTDAIIPDSPADQSNYYNLRQRIVWLIGSIQSYSFHLLKQSSSLRRSYTLVILASSITIAMTLWKSIEAISEGVNLEPLKFTISLVMIIVINTFIGYTCSSEGKIYTKFKEFDRPLRTIEALLPAFGQFKELKTLIRLKGNAWNRRAKLVIFGVVPVNELTILLTVLWLGSVILALRQGVIYI